MHCAISYGTINPIGCQILPKNACAAVDSLKLPFMAYSQHAKYLDHSHISIDFECVYKSQSRVIDILFPSIQGDNHIFANSSIARIRHELIVVTGYRHKF